MAIWCVMILLRVKRTLDQARELNDPDLGSSVPSDFDDGLNTRLYSYHFKKVKPCLWCEEMRA